MEKCTAVYRRNINGPLRYTWPNVNLFTSKTIYYNVLWSIRYRNCVDIDTIEHPIPNRAYGEFPDGWPNQFCAEVNQKIPSMLPILQCTFQCMRHTQKCSTGTQTFPIIKFGGRKHTTAFHKMSETNRHQTIKHLRQRMLWKLVVNWQQGMIVDLSVLGSHSSGGNYPDEDATKTLH